jgi:phasin family protein
MKQAYFERDSHFFKADHVVSEEDQMATKMKSAAEHGLGAMPFFPMKVNMPGLMPDKIQEMQIRNAEAMFSAARVVFEGLQMISTRNAEMLTSAFDRFAHDAEGLSKAEEPQKRLMKQAEMAQSTVQLALKNIRELTDMTNKCCFDAMNVLNARCAEALGEAEAQVNGGGSAKKSE